MPSQGARLGAAAVVALLGAVLAVTVTASPTSGEESPPRPNILLVVTDDQPIATEAATPRLIDWFEQGGTTYDNAYVTTSLCCPSRATIMSGRYAHNHGVEGNQAGQGREQFDPALTIQSQLAAAGYRTGYVGLFMPGFLSAPGFERYAVIRNYFNRPFWTPAGRQRRVNYAPVFVFNRSRLLAERWQDEPWLIVTAPYAPHQPNVPQRKHADDRFPWERPPNIHAPIDGKPDYVHESQTERRPGTQLRQAQHRTLRTVDTQFRRLVRALNDSGQLERTLVIFISDNGMLWGQHGLMGKIVPYRESVRVPMYARGPGIPAGEISSRLVANVDIAPTIYEAAGVTPSYEVDGQSILGGPEREALLLEHLRDRPGGGGKMGLRNMPAWASLVTPEHQYMRYSSGEEELYDLVADPFQLFNLAAAADPPDLEPWRLDLEAVRSCVGSACP